MGFYKAHLAQPFKKRSRDYLPWIAFFMALITFVVYLPALQNGFVNWDDDLYVYDNKGIQSIGIGFLRWAFTSEVASLWHPLTLFSLAFDYAVWGLYPAGYHLTNILLHTINTVLVFILVVQLVEYKGYEREVYNKSFIVGAVTAVLFSIHPLRVESVAWVSERKDVLCAFFYLLTLLAYLKYNRSSGSKRTISYGICLILFASALLSKPMAVSLPIVLLILDFSLPDRRGQGVAKWEIIEKIPFFLLSLATSMMTIWANSASGALRNLEAYPFVVRIFVSIRSYIFYLIKMLLPFNLAPLYPHPTEINQFSLEYLLPLISLLLITFFCIYSLKKTKLFLAIWLYYIVSLAPVIGVVRSGDIAGADRYTYLPSLGLFILIGLGTEAVLQMEKARKNAILVAFTLILFILIYRTEKQIGIWHDSITLWSHEVKFFPDVDTAYYNLGAAYGNLGDYQLALINSSRGIELNPIYADAYYNRGTLYYSLGQYKQAINDFSIAIELKSWKSRKYYTMVFNNRGIANIAIGQYQQAISDFNRGIELNPQDEFAYSNRGNAYFRMEEHQRAINDYSKAIEINPRYVDAYNNRGYVYYILGDNVKSINDLKKAVELDPGYAEAYYNLGMVYSRLGSRGPALDYYRKAARLGSKEAEGYLNKEGINK